MAVGLLPENSAGFPAGISLETVENWAEVSYNGIVLRQNRISVRG